MTNVNMSWLAAGRDSLPASAARSWIGGDKRRRSSEAAAMPLELGGDDGGGGAACPGRLGGSEAYRCSPTAPAQLDYSAGMLDTSDNTRLAPVCSQHDADELLVRGTLLAVTP